MFHREAMSPRSHLLKYILYTEGSSLLSENEQRVGKYLLTRSDESGWIADRNGQLCTFSCLFCLAAARVVGLRWSCLDFGGSTPLLWLAGTVVIFHGSSPSNLQNSTRGRVAFKALMAFRLHIILCWVEKTCRQLTCPQHSAVSNCGMHNEHELVQCASLPNFCPLITIRLTEPVSIAVGEAVPSTSYSEKQSWVFTALPTLNSWPEQSWTPVLPVHRRARWCGPSRQRARGGEVVSWETRKIPLIPYHD